MTTIDTTKADVLRAIETERDWWRAVFDLAAKNEPVTGDESVNGYWTFREIVAHVNGWRRWTATRLEAAASGSGNSVPPWPTGMADETEQGLDEINAWFMEQSHLVSFDTTIAETFSLLDRMRDAIDLIPEDRLLHPGFFAEADPQLAELPIGPALIGFTITHVHAEHAPDLEAWLTERIGQHVELPPAPSAFGYED